MLCHVRLLIIGKKTFAWCHILWIFKAVTETTNKSHTHLKATRQTQCWRDENSSFRFFICCIHSLPARAFLNVVMLVAVVKNHVEKSFLQPFLSFFLLQLLNIIPKKNTTGTLTLHKLGPCNFLYHNLSPSSSYYYSTMTLRMPYNFVHYKFPRISIYTSHNTCSIWWNSLLARYCHLSKEHFYYCYYSPP